MTRKEMKAKILCMFFLEVNSIEQWYLLLSKHMQDVIVKYPHTHHLYSVKHCMAQPQLTEEAPEGVNWKAYNSFTHTSTCVTKVQDQRFTLDRCHLFCVCE